jgi:hypothetical protein
MPRDLAIRCTCGALQGVVHAVFARAGNHAVCYCDDCQAFAHFLGRAADILDEQGGTQVFQMSPGRLAITAGADRLACMRLTPRGLLRWYAGCCSTPIGNTLATNKLPFFGLIHRCIQRPPEDPSLEAALGPIQARAFRRFAQGDRATIPANRIGLPRLFFRFAALMLRWKLGGDGRRSPFFDPHSGQPVVLPRVLSAAEHATLRLKLLQEPARASSTSAPRNFDPPGT